MDETMNMGLIVEFLLTTVSVLAVIALISILTPWMAKQVDKWIARYRGNHSPDKDSVYTVRSIYDIPPEEKEAAQKAEMAQDSENE